jgi:Icc-related predicted phosphoesterase
MLKIACISDTHSHHRKLNIPECDLLIHSGDLTKKGELDIIEDFCNWTKEIPAKKVICVYGNHELGHEYGPKRIAGLKMLADANIIYLEDSGINIDGFNIWGAPWQPTFYNWEFNRDRGPNIKYHWDKIPLDTNILITHGPPIYILDEVERMFGIEHTGCENLANKIKELKELKLHVFGHIHAGYGSKKINNTMFINAAICNNHNLPVNNPISFNL